MAASVVHSNRVKCYGTHHQADAIFLSYTRGRQCVPNSIAAIALSKIHNITSWDTDDLNNILQEGDALYTYIRGYNRRLCKDGLMTYEDIPCNCNVFHQQFSVTTTGQIFCDTRETSICASLMQLDQPTTLCDAIIVMGDMTSAYACSMMYHQNTIYLFDAHSRSPVTGMPCEDGTSVLLAFDSVAQCASYLATCASMLHAFQISIWKVSIQSTSQHAYEEQGDNGHNTWPDNCCEFCGKVIKNFKNFERHIRACEKKYTRQCQFCDKTFNNDTNLTSHMNACRAKQARLEEKQQAVYQCDICSKVVGNLTNLQTHKLACEKKKQKTQGPKPHVQRIQEQSVHEDVPCKRKHVMDLQSAGDTVDIDGTSCKNTRQRSQKKFARQAVLCCQFCDKTFNNNTNLTSHMNACRAKQARLREQQQVVYQCDICSKVVRNLSNLQRHKLACEKKQQKKRGPKPHREWQKEANRARMRNTRMDTEYRSKEQKDDTARRKSARMDTEYRSKEQKDDTARRKSVRMDTEYRSKEQKDNSARRHSARMDTEYRSKEQKDDTARRQSARMDTEYLIHEQGQKNIRRDISIYGTSLMESIQQFLAVTSEGPIYVCSACHQTHFSDHVQDVATLRPGSHNEILLQCLTGRKSIDNKEWLCVTCKRDIYQDLVPKLSVANKVGFPECPPELQLNTLEELLIAPLMPFMTVRSLPVCGQTAHGQKLIVGNVVHIPNDIASTVQSLPRILDDMGTVPVKLKRKKSYKTSVFHENIRPLKVIKGLEYLVKNSAMFQHYNIPLNTSPWLGHVASSDHDNRYFVEGNMPPTDELSDTEHDSEAAHDQPFEEIASSEYIHGNTDTMLIEDVPIYTDDVQGTSTSNTSSLSGNEILTLAPGEGQIPVFKEPRAEYLCFPTLFCGQERPSNSDRKRRVYTSELFKAELRHSDTRVCFNIQNIFWKAKHLQIQHVANKVTLALRRIVGSRTKPVTAGMLCDKTERDSITHFDEGYLIFRTIRNSPPYFEAKKKELMAMVRQLGIPTIFISLSSADTNWVPLLKCLGRFVDKQTYTDDYITNEMTFDKKCQLVAAHPAACSRFFNHRVQKFIKHILHSPYSHFGHVEDYFYRVEFQQRGSPHIHGLLWIQNAPQYGRSTHRDICDYIDKCISCSLDVTDAEKPFVKLQMHKHSRTCRKHVKGQKTCRFGAPWPPIPETCILDPLEANTCTNVDELQTCYQHIQKQLRKIPDHIRTFDDWLHHLNMTEHTYIEALRTSLIRPKVFIKRAICETRVNPYMKDLLLAWQANHDAQFVLDPYQCVTYICDYLTKSQKGMSAVLAEACDQAKAGSMTLKESVRHMGNTFLNITETPVQECVYNILQLLITDSTRKKEFISTCLPEERVSLTKSIAELETMNPNSKDVTHKSNIDRYTMRPRRMNSWCLADYVAKIDIEYPKKGMESQSDDITDDTPDPEGLETHLEDISYEYDDDFPILLRNGLKLKLRRKNKVIRFVHYRQKSNPEQYARERLLLYVPWRHEDKILGDCATYQDAFALHIDSIRSKMAVYEPLSSVLEDIEEELAQERQEDDVVVAPSTQYADEVDCDTDQAHDIHTHAEPLDHVPFDIGPCLGLPVVQYDALDVEFVQNMPSDAEHVQLISSLNRGQQEFYSHIMHSALQGSEQVLCALHGGAGTGKSTAIRAIHQGLYKLLNKQPGCDPSIPHVLLLAPTGKAAYNIRGTTIHRAFCIAANQKLEYRQMTRDRLNTIRSQFRGIQWLVIDEVSMVGNRMLEFMHLRLQEIKGNKLPFGGLHMIFVGDLHQLQPVMQQYIFMDSSSAYGALATNLWKEYFTVYELTEIMRQKGDKQFAELLNRLRTGHHTEDDINVLKTRTITQAESLEMSDIPHFFPTRDSTEGYNTEVLNQSTGFTTTVEAMDAASTDVSHNTQQAILAAARHKNVNSTGGLPYTLMLKVGQLYDVTANLDVNDGIINGSECHIRYIEPNPHNQKFPKYVWVQFTDPSIGRERRRKCMQTSSDRRYAVQKLTPIEAIQRTFTVKHDQTVVRTQFPLRLASARTIHVAQSSTYQQIIVDMSTEKKPPKHFWDHMHYVAFSRCTSLQGLHIIDINEACIHTSDRVKHYLTHDKKDMQLCYVPTYNMQNHIHVAYNNVGSIQHKWPAIKHNDNITGAHVIILAETWLAAADETSTYELPGFSQYRQDSSQVVHHRGLLMYIKDDIKSINTVMKQNAHLEMCHCDVPFNDTRLQIVGIYKPPTTTVSELKQHLYDIIAELDLTIPLVVLGDFNLDVHAQCQFVEYMLAEYKLHQQISTSTTWAGTSIDLVFTNCPDISAYALANTWSTHHVLFSSLPL